jgi:hypothetical protein
MRPPKPRTKGAAIMPDAGSNKQSSPEGRIPQHHVDLIPREFLKAIAVWSLIPAYMIAGAFLGWIVSLWLPRDFAPYSIGIGLILGLGFSVRDVLRLRDSW